MRECKELQIPTPTFLNGELQFFCIFFYNKIVLEGFAVISEETNALLLDTFDNIEEEEFFEVIYNIPNHVFWT